MLHALEALGREESLRRSRDRTAPAQSVVKLSYGLGKAGGPIADPPRRRQRGKG